MSRTIRFKDYERVHNTSWDRKFRKTALDKTDYKFSYCQNCNTRHGGVPILAEDWYDGYTWVSFRDGLRYRYTYCKNHIIDSYYEGYELSGREWFETWYRRHGESHRHGRSPTREWRNRRVRENRRINNRELQKFMSDPDNYEPMCETEPRSCWWDWD